MNGWMRQHCSIRETARFAKCRPGGAALLFLLSVGLHGTGCRDGRTLKRAMTHLSLGNFHTITGPKAALGENPLGSRLKRGDECTWALLLRLKGGSQEHGKQQHDNQEQDVQQASTDVGARVLGLAQRLSALSSSPPPPLPLVASLQQPQAPAAASAPTGGWARPHQAYPPTAPPPQAYAPVAHSPAQAASSLPPPQQASASPPPPPQPASQHCAGCKSCWCKTQNLNCCCRSHGWGAGGAWAVPVPVPQQQQQPLPQAVNYSAAPAQLQAQVMWGATSHATTYESTYAGAAPQQQQQQQQQQQPATSSSTCSNSDAAAWAPQAAAAAAAAAWTPDARYLGGAFNAQAAHYGAAAVPAPAGGESRWGVSVVVVSSEISPFSKSGGLADVADKLSVALARLGHRVMTIAPLYKGYDGVKSTQVKSTFQFHGEWHAEGGHTVEYCHCFESVGGVKGVDHVFVKHASFARAGMYGEGGQDYGDNLFRFALFAWAALEAPLVVPCGGVPYGENVVFLANDWQAGLVPLVLNSHYRRYKVYTKARVVFDIHNLGYQGSFPNPPFSGAPPFSFCDFGLRDDAYYDKYFWVYPECDRAHALDKGEAIKMLKGGIEMSDRVVTVSPSYCQEIMTVEGAWGMKEVTTRRCLDTSGILNGIDLREWDPSNDSYLLPIKYSKEDPSGKKLAKAALQKELGLDVNEHVPLLAFIGRLAPQKGVDLIEAVFPWLMSHDETGKAVTGDVQLVMMGNGEERYANFLRNAEAQNKGKVCGFVGFTAEMEHKILAGADILLMPSRYEPCGLPQMYAQRYGTVPVVHATGGLKDSVIQYDPFSKSEEGVGTGWQFNMFDAGGLKYGIYNAIDTFKHYKEAWRKMIVRCMNMNFSWDKSASKYVNVFREALAAPPHINPLPFI